MDMICVYISQIQVVSFCYFVTLGPTSPNPKRPNPKRRFVGVLNIKILRNLQGVMCVNCEFQFKHKCSFQSTQMVVPPDSIFRFPFALSHPSLLLLLRVADDETLRSAPARPASSDLRVGKCLCFGVVT